MVDTWWKMLWLDDSKVINANHHHSKSVTDYLRHTCSIDLIKASLCYGRDKASEALKSLNKKILEWVINIMVIKNLLIKSMIYQHDSRIQNNVSNKFPLCFSIPSWLIGWTTLSVWPPVGLLSCRPPGMCWHHAPLYTRSDGWQQANPAPAQPCSTPPHSHQGGWGEGLREKKVGNEG